MATNERQGEGPQRCQNKSVLVGGGARSGKSRWAEALTLSIVGPSRSRPVYIATAQCYDDEMTERVRRHRADRGERFRTVEEPLELVEVLRSLDVPSRSADRPPAILVECLTLWLSNLLMTGVDDAEVDTQCDALASVLREIRIPTVLVTNEVGLGIVPDNALARRFRDAAGRLNQDLAELCDEVYFSALGLPLRLKPGPVQAVLPPTVS